MSACRSEDSLKSLKHQEQITAISITIMVNVFAVDALNYEKMQQFAMSSCHLNPLKSQEKLLFFQLQ